ncbi:response regulator, partial [Sulfuricurvum sp.]|uniref:response regulator n=1 Tax=Sulfuricurvum sp. TaxID=2025608 RepID=UPI00261ABA95
NSSKIRSTLDAYDAEAFSNRKQKATRRKKFDEKNSRFAASALVAEDNVINQKLIRRTLEDLGLEITLANNGLEAFEKRKNGNFDIIFMDIQMPVLDGIEATQEILDFEEDYSQNHIPIIALTANALKGDRERFMAAGMDEYTTKPLVRSEIISLLNNFLSHKIIEIKAVPKTVHDISTDPESTPVVSNELPIEENVDFIDETSEIETPSEIVLSSEAAEVFVEVAAEEVTEKVVEEIHHDEVPEITDLAQPAEIAPELPEVHRSHYDADILIAKQNTLEMKLFSRILSDLGYTYKSVNDTEALHQELKEGRYKLALFDKSLHGLNLKDLYDIIRTNDNETSLVMLVDPNVKEDEDDSLYVHEIIKNIVNKDLLRLVFEKFI